MTDTGGTDEAQGADGPGQASDVDGTVQAPGDDGRAPRFDPRHDPVFQRGYDPAASVLPAASIRPARASRHPERPDPTHPTPPNRDLSTFPAERDSAQVEAQATDVEGHAAQTPRVDYGSAPEAQRNPFIVALWFIGVALVVGGITLQWQATLNSYNGPGFNTEDIPFEVVWQQLVWMIAPASISVGAMTLVGLVFWHAVTWRAAQRVAEDPAQGAWPDPNHDA